jgi:hypothetical protein
MMKQMSIVGIISLVVLIFGCIETTGKLQQTLDGGVIGGQAQSLPAMDYSQYGKPGIAAKILLLIPYEFESFLFTSRYQEMTIQHQLGFEAEHELRTAFGIEFADVQVRPVASEATASDMLLPRNTGDTLFKQFDFVAIPKFLKVDSSVENGYYLFSIDLSVAFTGPDGSTLTITGHGESRTGQYIVTTPEKCATHTLQLAVSAILDRIEKRRSFFQP